MIYLAFRISVIMWYLMKMLRSKADPCHAACSVGPHRCWVLGAPRKSAAFLLLTRFSLDSWDCFLLMWGVFLEAESRRMFPAYVRSHIWDLQCTYGTTMGCVSLSQTYFWLFLWYCPDKQPNIWGESLAVLLPPLPFCFFCDLSRRLSTHPVFLSHSWEEELQ